MATADVGALLFVFILGLPSNAALTPYERSHRCAVRQYPYVDVTLSTTACHPHRLQHSLRVRLALRRAGIFPYSRAPRASVAWVSVQQPRLTHRMTNPMNGKANVAACLLAATILSA